MNVKIDLPAYPLPMRARQGVLYLWDPVRRKILKYRPEERVRQQFIMYLVFTLGVPPGSIGVEQTMGSAGRADVIIYSSPDLEPETLVEIKSPGRPLDHTLLTQMGKYAGTAGFSA